jgi:hypothetical protein
MLRLVFSDTDSDGMIRDLTVVGTADSIWHLWWIMNDNHKYTTRVYSLEGTEILCKKGLNYACSWSSK